MKTVKLQNGDYEFTNEVGTVFNLTKYNANGLRGWIGTSKSKHGRAVCSDIHETLKALKTALSKVGAQ